STNQFSQALTGYLEAMRTDDHFAELHFRIARCYFAGGQMKEAKEQYILSRDWDALQFRADSRRNRIIREVASKKRPGVSLIEGEQAFAESPLSEHEIPGSQLFNDHVHMSFDGDYALAKAFYPGVVSALGLTNTSGPAPLPSRVECAQ